MSGQQNKNSPFPFDLDIFAPMFVAAGPGPSLAVTGAWSRENCERDVTPLTPSH